MSIAAGLIGACWISLGALHASEDEYEYVPDTNRWVSFFHGDVFSIGKLDAKGSFLPDPRWLNMRGFASNVPKVVWLNVNKGGAYEFRSGRLILGELDEEGS